MVTPELKQLTSTNLDRSALPADPEDCSVLLDAEIGPRGQEGGDRFSFIAITPKYLLHEPLPRWGQGCLIVDCFSWSEIERSLQRLLDHSTRNTWQEVAESLSHDLDWEFKNYRPFGA